MLIGVSRVNMLQCRKMLIALLRIFEPPAPNPSHFPFFEGVVYHLNNSRKLQKCLNASFPRRRESSFPSSFHLCWIPTPRMGEVGR